jgi:hypothetical protein
VCSSDLSPVVFCEVVSKNDSRSCVVRIKNVTTNGYEVKIEGSEKNRTHGSEMLSFIAVEPGNTGVLFAETTGREVNHNYYQLGKEHLGFFTGYGLTARMYNNYQRKAYGYMDIDWLYSTNKNLVFQQLADGINPLFVKPADGLTGEFSTMIIKNGTQLCLNSDLSVDNNPHLIYYFDAEEITKRGDSFRLVASNGNKYITTAGTNHYYENPEDDMGIHFPIDIKEETELTVFCYGVGDGFRDTFYTQFDFDETKIIKLSDDWEDKVLIKKIRRKRVKPGSHTVSIFPREAGVKIKYIAVATARRHK